MENNNKNWKEEIALGIKAIYIDKFYWILFAVSVAIASFGLIQSSTAVIIGAMLIAPLLRPLTLFSFSIVNSHNKDSYSSFLVLVLSILLGILISFVIAKIFPFPFNENEILARTNPNLLDFFVALLSSFVAFLALTHRDWIVESVAGVAIATSLVPPLAVVGIELSFGHYFLGWEAFLLFFTNLITIILGGIIWFFIIGFRPHQEEDQKRFKMNILILFLILSFIFLLLLASILNLKNEYLIRETFKNNLKGIEKILVIKNDEGYLVKIDLYREKEDLNKLRKEVKKIKNELKEEIEKKIEVEVREFQYKMEKI